MDGGAGLPPAKPAGFLLCDKPAGSSSHRVVAAARHEHGMKAGHAGTLDPFATGLLVVLLGQATRLQRYVLGLPKRYLATARLGWRSSTGDPEGELERTGRIPEELALPTGSVVQRVPMTSAVRVGGERLYRKAHRGQEADRPQRRVDVYRADLVDHDPAAGTARFEIECSAGTYVRTLIEELGDAYCLELRRTAVGHLRLPEGGDPPEARPVEELVGHLPARELDPGEATDVVHGRWRGDPAGTDGPIRLLFEGRLLAIAAPENDALRTEVVLA